MTSFSSEALLQLNAIQGIGPARLKLLIRHFGSPENALKASEKDLLRVKGLDQTTIYHFCSSNNKRFVESQLQRMQENNVRLISCWDTAFPDTLKRIPDAPVFVYFKGNPAVLKQNALAVVGTRNPSAYGKLITERFVDELSGKNFCIVSGLARGVDTLAHRTALNRDGMTIAVLAGGIDWIYPAENKSLAEEIAEKGGLISEYPLGLRPEAMNFPKRNRIISGLSTGVLVTEAGIKSGALITAFNALEQNREVFAIPGPITSDRSRGTNQLIREGAKLVESLSDITEELSGQLELFSGPGTDRESLPALDEREERLLQVVQQEPVHIDVLAQTTAMTTAELLSILLNLELNGVVKQLPGKMFVKLI